ncbi:heparinase II/III domain-containing protein [Paenibacillus koleovorans]|uniref:heparinase II/III domain-containing protein n=1 Tax=Paenibacillus koleovorans TaxID=121608 RepID=UPI0013E3FA40|nr:heparinase II/III family protein [Paenibacillus koleovorans]
MLFRLPYVTSAYELAESMGAAQAATASEAMEEIKKRIAREKDRRELEVYYYRVGYTLSFPLPLARLPKVLPEPIPGFKYPWFTWLLWELKDRWDLLHIGWRRYGDEQAGLLLQQELAELSEWDNYKDYSGDVSLCTGHLADCLAQYLAEESGWESRYYQKAVAAATKLIDQDVWPWYETSWMNQEITVKRMHNINCIILFGSAALAKVLRNAHESDLDNTARMVFAKWMELGNSSNPHTEGVTYDGFLLETVTDWMMALPDADALWQAAKEPLTMFVTACQQLSLPGRPDLHAPLGDIEPEMPFWMTVILRCAKKYDLPDVYWLLRRIPLVRLTTAALAELAEEENSEEPNRTPESGGMIHPAAITLRTGWSNEDTLAAISISRNEFGHLHCDGGHLVIGTNKRFWITDPGYQQYRPGFEQDYSLGVEAHNAPVIEGVSQSRRAAKPLAAEVDAQGNLYADMDLSLCYDHLPADTSVKRSVRLIPGQGASIVVCDSIDSKQGPLQIGYHWLGGTYLAWAFHEGWARLSDGELALWIKVISGGEGVELTADCLKRHEGTRGPLTLCHNLWIAEGKQQIYWVFHFQDSKVWNPPQHGITTIY